MPDINGQKLMSAKNMNTISQSLILPKLFMAIFMILILTIPFYILQINPLHVDYASGELAFVSIFKYAIPKQLYFIVVLFFFLPFLSAVNNTQNWSAALLVQNFYKYYIEKQASDKKLYRLGMLTMIFIVFMAAIFAVFNDSILDIFKYILAISAGVGPVFILRWYWHRINAWTQLSAMVLSLIYPNIYEILYHNNEAFHNGILTLMNAWNLDYHPLKIILLSVSVIGSWLIVTFLTKQTDEKTITQFVDAVKPGGFWPRKSCGNVFFKKRLFIALMLTVGGFLFYYTFWQFVKGNYGLTLLLLVIYLLINYLGYVLLKKLNSRYMDNRE
jgi:Na+/proline symporter